VSACQLYLDEDTSDADLVFALRQRDLDVLTAIEAGRKAATDEDHLLWGAS
jgi:hypothetical protein